MRVLTRRCSVGALLLLSFGLSPAANGRPLPDRMPAELCVAGPNLTAAGWDQEAVIAPAEGPQARSILRIRGTLPHTGIHDASSAAERDLGHMRDLALAWRLAGDRDALDRLATYLDAWTHAYRPGFDPIDESNFDGLIEAFALTNADLPRPIALRTRDFVHAMGDGYLDRMERSRYPFPGNNWQSHRIKLATLAAVALDDPALFRRARAAFIRQLGDNIAADGEVRDFGERDALHYVVYDLEPLLHAALAARERGEDWLHLAGPDGQTLATGLNWLLPYAQGKRQHQEFVHSTVAFDAERDRAGLKGYSGLWDRHAAGDLYWSASVLDHRYGALAKALEAKPPRWLFAYASPCGAKAIGKVALMKDRR